MRKLNPKHPVILFILSFFLSFCLSYDWTLGEALGISLFTVIITIALSLGFYIFVFQNLRSTLYSLFFMFILSLLFWISTFQNSQNYIQLSLNWAYHYFLLHDIEVSYHYGMFINLLVIIGISLLVYIFTYYRYSPFILLIYGVSFFVMQHYLKPTYTSNMPLLFLLIIIIYLLEGTFKSKVPLWLNLSYCIPLGFFLLFSSYYVQKNHPIPVTFNKLPYLKNSPLSTVTYSNTGLNTNSTSFKNNISQDFTPVMEVQATRPMYLRGVIKTEYDGITLKTATPINYDYLGKFLTSDYLKNRNNPIGYQTRPYVEQLQKNGEYEGYSPEQLVQNIYPPQLIYPILGDLDFIYNNIKNRTAYQQVVKKESIRITTLKPFNYLFSSGNIINYNSIFQKDNNKANESANMEILSPYDFKLGVDINGSIMYSIKKKETYDFSTYYFIGDDGTNKQINSSIDEISKYTPSEDTYIENNFYDWQNDKEMKIEHFGDKLILDSIKYSHKISYTEVSSVTERTKQLAASITAPFNTRYEKAKAIEKYLQSNYTYTLSPNINTDYKDYVDFFLFENKKGYCTSFASSMFILCRTIGIPSRYVEGYVMPKDPIKGKYIVREAEAHAWTEVYFDGLGWIPFEATPGYQYLTQVAKKDNPQNDTPTKKPSTNPTIPNKKPQKNTVVNHNTDTSTWLTKDLILTIFEVLGSLLVVFLLLLLRSWYSLETKLKRVSPSQQLEILYDYTLKCIKAFHMNKSPKETNVNYLSRIEDSPVSIFQPVYNILSLYDELHFSEREVMTKDILQLQNSYLQLRKQMKAKKGKLYYLFHVVLLKRI